jgi:hypothetical protein
VGALHPAHARRSGGGDHRHLRPEAFSADTALSLWLWGARSLVGPGVFMGGVLLLATAVRFVVRPIGASVSRTSAGRRLARLREALSRRRRGGLNDLAQIVVVLQIAAIAAICWAFRALLSTLPAAVSTTPPSLFAVLGPGVSRERIWFSFAASMALVAMMSLWTMLLHCSRRSPRPIDRGAVAAGLALIMLLFVILAMPYRLAWHNRFERVDYDSLRCYILGMHESDALLYCPGASAPRNRVVSLSDGRIRRTGLIESIFTQAQ